MTAATHSLPRHFIHYIPRTVVSRFPKDLQSPWFADVRDLTSPADFERPRFHASRREAGPAGRVCPGDIIWLIGQIRSPWGKLAPALDARIVVERVETKEGHRTYRAAPDSEWFGLNRVGDVLSNLETQDLLGRRSPLWRDDASPIGHALQSMRVLRDPQAMETHAERLRQLDLDFVSYRIKDGTRSAFHHVDLLLSQGKLVFWDRWCLPRRLAERRELPKAEALNAYLLQQLDKAQVMWAVPSHAYAQPGSYSAVEHAHALAAGKLKTIKP